jgi:6-phosphogluconolactonase
MTQIKNISTVVLGLFILTLYGCGGGGGGGAATGPGATPTPTPGATPAPADRWVLSGNSDSTISILRVDPVAGFASAVAYHDLNTTFGIQDMVYHAATGRILTLTSNELRTLSFDTGTSQLGTVDVRPTSNSSSTHFVLNSAGTAAYVATGTSNNQFVDVFSIDATGRMDPRVAVPVSVDPDYITLNPTEDRLYVVSRADDQIVIFDINTDGSLAASPTTINTDQNPTSLVFHPTLNIAYLTRADNSGDSLQVMNIGANGDLAPSGTFFNVDSNATDMVLSADASSLYVIETNNAQVHHFSVDNSGALTFVAEFNLGFTPSDLTLSSTGAELYISHNTGDLVSTLSVNPGDGALTLMGAARVFDNANTVAAVGGLGALTPTATFLLAPDVLGLSKFSIGPDGLLSLVNREDAANALISGEVAVQYAAGLLLGAGETASPDRFDLLTSYTFNPVTGDLNFIQQFDATANAAVSPEAKFQRIELGRSGRFMYILDEDIVNSGPPADIGFIRSYAYASNGNFTTTPFDTDSTGRAPENMTLHPAGRYLYSINSFGDNISIFEVDETSGSLTGRGSVTPGGTGAGNGRPIDLKFHPNGRFAYVSLEDDSQMVKYTMEENGSLSAISRTSPPQDNGVDVQPGPIAVHPNGRYLYVGEGNGRNNIAIYDINQTNFSLTYRARISVTDNPSWIEVDPSGQRLYLRAGGNVRVFNIDQTTGVLTDTTQSVVVGNSGFLPSMTLVTPLQ